MKQAVWIGLLVVIAGLGGGRFAAAQEPTQTPETPEIDCRALMAGEAAQLSPQSDEPRARIVAPEPNATVFGNQVTVQIDPENFTIEQGNHWHIWVDGELRGMIYEPTTVIDVEPGRHEICAILGDAEHMDLGIPAGIVVTAMEAGAGTPTSVPVVANAPAPMPETQASDPVRIALVVVIGVVAAVGGWWLGKRMPGRRG